MTSSLRRSAFSLITIGLIGTCLPAGTAFADVKAGVDAWAQGDYAKALREWTPLAQAGDADALFNLGQAYKLGRGVPVDMNRALDYYRQAAAKGHMQAEDNYGLLLFQQNRRVEAMPYLERSARRGEARAQYLYGIALFNGDLTGKDWPAAYAMMTRASQAGVPQAAASLQQMNQHIPEDQRIKGLSLAEDIARQENAARLAAMSGMDVESGGAGNRGVGDASVGGIGTKPAPKPTSVRSAANASPPPSSMPKTPAAKAKTPTIASTAPQPAAPKATTGGKWRAQLGAFSEAGGAQRMWKNLSAKVKPLASYQSYMVKAGAVTRLQAGPFASRDDAEKLCRQIRAAGGDCIPKSL
ncbi:MAG: hypothetical protein E2598_10990 [Sphingobium sp.]|nr:hypothetical protein [Sphingobium sp.]